MCDLAHPVREYMLRIIILIFSAISMFFVVTVASAHEVYVLNDVTIEKAMLAPPLQVFEIIFSDKVRFFFWFFFVLLVLSSVGVISMSKRLETMCDPLLLRLRPFAPLIARLTLSLSIIASAWYGALFGPELPLSGFLTFDFLWVAQGVLALLGFCLFLGVFTREVAVILMTIFFLMIIRFHSYMLTYINYLGEMILVFTLGGGSFAIDSLLKRKEWCAESRLLSFIRTHDYLIMRVCFGVSLLYAALFAKFIHAELAIQTVIEYHLTDYFHFSPPFIVLGALAVECLLASLFILGIEVRFASVFLMIFLIMSLLYFGETVWPHIVLMGGALTIFAAGYSTYTFERHYLNTHKRSNEEPVF